MAGLPDQEHPMIREVKRSIWGSARFASFDPRGLHYFNLTIEGFWRSFLAAVVSLPLFLAIDALSYRPTEFIHYLNLALGYGISWIALPLVMIPVVIALELRSAYIPFVVTYNWTSVITYGLALVTVLLFHADNTIGASLSLAFWVVSCLYRWFVAKVALNAGILIPIVVVVLDQVLATLISRGLVHLFGDIPSLLTAA
jgi:hypothetical protein